MNGKFQFQFQTFLYMRISVSYDVNDYILLQCYQLLYLGPIYKEPCHKLY